MILFGERGGAPQSSRGLVVPLILRQLPGRDSHMAVVVAHLTLSARVIDERVPENIGRGESGCCLVYCRR